MDRWSKGRVVLLGDAAHCASPASGQGTGLALTGAYVLAAELARSGGDHTAAFARCEAHMRPGVERNQRMAEGFVKEMVVGSRWKTSLRMLMVRLLPKTPWKNLVAKKIRDEIQAAAHAVPLPDEPLPATDRSAPATGRSAPLPDRPTPLPDRPTPLPDQPLRTTAA
ncbi:FAD-dependent monooxygenase [Streptomyces sp. NPDC088915]|uniref:FAD-dependent monooxygenase n=1 Tax=Streptomyces sp. NPDC088915 TaxID=3365912 RepID=UPI003812A05C